MNRHEKELERLAHSYAEAHQSFWDFHEGFLSCWTRLPPDALSDAKRREWNEIYTWVLTSIPDPVSEEDGARGVIGEAELRSRIRRHLHLDTPR